MDNKYLNKFVFLESIFGDNNESSKSNSGINGVLFKNKAETLVFSLNFIKGDEVECQVISADWVLCIKGELSDSSFLIFNGEHEKYKVDSWGKLVEICKIINK